jgi:hypothetical protein
MDGLTEGRIVHYVMPNGKHRPAIITKVWRVPDSPGPEPILKTPENGMSNMMVFADPGDDGGGPQYSTSVIYAEEPLVNTWHWIEKA